MQLRKPKLTFDRLALYLSEIHTSKKNSKMSQASYNDILLVHEMKESFGYSNVQFVISILKLMT